ncbi:unnamed protein product [Paramecium primaurelia]|uniref:Uncharacterized protein n=1 Tax=Paramecium primaurelia TaxID=5886 RepID=A0A8S1NWB1_PARPR|nr:unnamed protein product [Paramecium primaurelia]
MQTLLSLMSKLSSISSHEVLDSEQEISKKAFVPTLRTPFENDKFKQRKEEQLNNDSYLKVNLSNQLLSSTSLALDKLSQSILELDASNNLFNQFPNQLKYYNNLKILNLSNNQIQEIPIKFYLPNLEKLILSDNQIKQLPSSLFKLRTLRELNLNNNNIEYLPSELFQLKLTYLGLRSNLFTTIPAKFEEILESLQCFDIDWFDYCKISSELDKQIKQKLILLGQRVVQKQEIITFSLFYYYMVGKVFDIQQSIQNGKNILFTFIQRNSIGLLKQYSQKYPELNLIKDEDECSPLLYAFNLHRMKCIQCLLPVFKKNKIEMQTLFMLSAKQQDIQLMKILIQNGIELNYQIEKDILGPNKFLITSGSTVMHIAMTSFGRNAQQQQQASIMVKLLLDMGCDPNIRNQLKLTSLHAAIILPSLAAVRFASNCTQFDFQKRDLYKNTPLHSASQMGLVTILQCIQEKNINPFSLNIYNKTAKQMSIASLQVIKIQKKYENEYLRKKLLLENEDQQTSQKNENLSSLNSSQSITQNLQATEMKSQLLSPQSQQQHRRIFRLNLNQVKLMEQNYQIPNRQQQLSKKSMAPKIQEILTNISQILRKYQNSNNLILEIKNLYHLTDVLQEKLIIAIFVNLILMKLKYHWKYLSSIGTSTISDLNQTKIVFQKPLSSNEYFICQNQEFIKKYKQNCLNIQKIDDISNANFRSQKQQLSLNLKYNLHNNWEETLNQYEQFYQNSLGDTQWIICMKGLKIQNKIKTENNNRMLLYQYEQFQNNQVSQTQFIRVIQRQMDYYKEQKVDNSESVCSLSDRLNQYNKTQLINKKVNQYSLQKSNKMEFHLRNFSQKIARRVSPQVQQHLGEKAQTFRKDSAIINSIDISLDNL